MKTLYFYLLFGNNAFLQKTNNILILLQAVYAKALPLIWWHSDGRCMPNKILGRTVRVSTHRKNSKQPWLQGTCLRAFAKQAENYHQD
jgi:hypothetical protein